jgi:hypothetical protein
LKIIPNNELNRDAWDLLIATSEQGNFYALSWYLDIVSPGWSAIVEGTHQEYRIGIPLPVTRKWGFRILKQPLFCQQLGIYSITQPTQDVVAEIVNLITRKFNYIIKYSFSNFNTPRLLSGSLSENLNVVLNLNQPYDVLKSNYKRDRKYRLMQVLNSNVFTQESNSLEELICMFKENGEKKIYGGVSSTAYEMLHQIFYETATRGLANLIYAKVPPDKIIAGALFIKFKNRITYMFNAGYSEFVKLNGRTLILDSVIRKYQNQPLLLDFECPGLKNISTFYRSFGGLDEIYLSLSQNHLPWPVKKIHAMRKKYYERDLYDKSARNGS